MSLIIEIMVLMVSIHPDNVPTTNSSRNVPARDHPVFKGTKNGGKGFQKQCSWRISSALKLQALRYSTLVLGGCCYGHVWNFMAGIHRGSNQEW